MIRGATPRGLEDRSHRRCPGAHSAKALSLPISLLSFSQRPRLPCYTGGSCHGVPVWARLSTSGKPRSISGAEREAQALVFWLLAQSKMPVYTQTAWEDGIDGMHMTPSVSPSCDDGSKLAGEWRVRGRDVGWMCSASALYVWDEFWFQGLARPGWTADGRGCA